MSDYDILIERIKSLPSFPVGITGAVRPEYVRRDDVLAAISELNKKEKK